MDSSPAPPQYDYSTLERQVIGTFGTEKIYERLDEAFYCLAAWSEQDPGDPAFMDRYHLIWELRNTLGKLKKKG